MSAPHDDKKRPGVAKPPTDSDSVGLSTVPRRRIVVGGDPKAGSSNPPAESAPSKRASPSSDRGREKRSSAPAHLRNRREKLAGTGYSEVPANAEERVAPSAIPRAPRLPQIDGEGEGPGGANARTAVGVLGVGARRDGDEVGRSTRGVASPTPPSEGRTSERRSSPSRSKGPLRRSDTARSVVNPTLQEADASGTAAPTSAASTPIPSGSAAASLHEPARGVSPAAVSAMSGGTLIGGMNPLLVAPAVLPKAEGPFEAAGGFDEVGPVTDANFPPVYSPSGTLQSMSAVRPEVGDFPGAGKFKSTLTGAGYLSAEARDLLSRAGSESDRSASRGPESGRFHPERTMVGLPQPGGPQPVVKPLRPSPPPVVLSEPRGASLLVAIAEAAQGQLRESEIPVPSERLEAEVLQQLGQLDEALKSSPRVPSFDRAPSSRPSRPFSAQLGDRDSDASFRIDSAPGSSIDAPSPGSVPSPSALPGDAPAMGPTGLPTVGRYEVLARLKSGGMGSVYMCRLSGNAGFRRLFAMKVLHAHLNRDAEALESFQREARVLACVHHPNIVGVVDFGSEHEPYIVLEYVEGGSLHELLRATTGGRDPRLVLTIILDVLEGLTAAHAANDENGAPLGLVHCDVCPQNILVGVDGTSRLTDFGIAQTNESRLHPEQLRGKPRYLAPERTTSGSIDARVDLFSLGVVLYAALTGVEPFVGETAEETRWNVANKAVPAPSTVGFRPPPSLDWLCLKALAKDPAGRFQSAEEMASQLRRIGEREGLLAPRNEVSEWVRITLAPSLAARRVASRRGTVTGGGRLGSMTPPPVQAVEPGLGQPPRTAPPPSSAENTAPLSSEASDFSENTEVIGGDGAKRLRSKRVLYGTIALCVGILLWGMLAPQSLAKMFSIEDESGSAEGNEAPAPEDPAGAIVPELGPSFEDSAKAPEAPPL